MAGASIVRLIPKTASLIAVLFPLAAPALAHNLAAQPQPQPTDPINSVEPWAISFEPTIWAPAIDGEVQLPGGTGRPDYRRFGVDSPHPTGLGVVRLHKKKLTINVSGFDFSFHRGATTDSALSVGGLSFTAGQAANIDINLASAQATAGWRIIEKVLTPADAPKPVSLNLDVYGGIRGYSFKTTIAAVGAGSVSNSGFWIEPIIGARGSVDIFNHVRLLLSLDGGAQPLGDHTSSSFDITFGLQWIPTAHLGVQFGWRQLIVDLQNGSGSDKLKLNNGTLAGVFGSLVVRF